MWDRKNLPHELAVEEVPGAVYGLSSKGWIDQELFHLWFTKYFLLYAPPALPLLLLMDGQPSHYCPATIRHAAEERVILLSLNSSQHHPFVPTMGQGNLWATEGFLDASLCKVWHLLAS